MSRAKRDAVLVKLGQDTVLHLEHAANCFGVKSRGLMQIRGNGCWALTAEKIYFEYWVGGRTIEIPLPRITGLRIARSFLYKTKGWPLLIVAFNDDQNRPDEAAWLFRDLEATKAALEQAKS
jgi:hypothetical protein